MLSLAQPNNGKCPPETSPQNLLDMLFSKQVKQQAFFAFLSPWHRAPCHFPQHDEYESVTESIGFIYVHIHLSSNQYGAPHLLTKYCQNRKALLLSKLLFRHQGWVHAAFKGTHTVECQMQHLEKTCNSPLCCEDHQTNSTESRECCHWRSQTMAIARQKHLHKIYLTCFSQRKSNSKHFLHSFHHDIVRLATFLSMLNMKEYDWSLHMLIIQYRAPHLLTKHCQNWKALLLSKLLFRHQGWVHAAFKGTHTVECQMQHLEKTCNSPLCCEDHQTNSTESRECCHWRSQTMAIARQKHLHKIYLTCFSQCKSNSKHFLHSFHHDIVRLATFHSMMNMNQ